MKSRQLYWSDSTKCGADGQNFALHFLLRYFPFSCDILYGWVKLWIKYRLLFVAKVLDFVSWHHSFFYQHLANCMQSRSEETQRFPFIPLSVSDWLIRTSSNQRRPNGVTAASWRTENLLRILGASNAGFFYIFYFWLIKVLSRSRKPGKICRLWARRLLVSKWMETILKSNA